MNLHQKLIDAQATLFLAHAGAGTAFAQRLWQTPGSSAYFGGAVFLQARTEFNRFIGFDLKTGYCSKEAAIELATAAYIRAAQTKEIAPAENENLVGLGITATVATTRIPRGKHRAHIAIVTHRGVFHEIVALNDETGFYARLDHDKVIAEAAEALLRISFGKNSRANATGDAINLLKRFPLFLPSGARQTDADAPGLYFPGNYNPIHQGHRQAYLQAEKETRLETIFMLEAQPPNKAEIPYHELLRRIANLHKLDTLQPRTILLTFGHGTYLAKAQKHPGSHFIAGADATIRLLEPYWGYDVGDMLQQFEELDTTFHVLGRYNGVKHITVEDIDIPEAHRARFRHLEGRHDISSTELRNQK